MIPRQSPNASADASPTSFSPEHLRVLLREAAAGAHGLVRKLRLPNHEHEDFRQDLLVDLIGRFRQFNPDRGSLGAFAGVIVRHRAERLAHRVYRERTIFAPISLED